MENTNETMSNREWIHKMVDMIQDEGDLAMVKWLLKPYVARSLNKKYREEKNHEAQDQGHAPEGEAASDGEHAG